MLVSNRLYHHWSAVVALSAVLLLMFITAALNRFSGDTRSAATTGFRNPATTMTTTRPIAISLERYEEHQEEIGIVPAGMHHGIQEWVIANDGLDTAQLRVGVTNIRNAENGCNFAERIADTTCGVLDGELGQHIRGQLFFVFDDIAVPFSTFHFNDQAIGTVAADWRHLADFAQYYPQNTPTLLTILPNDKRIVRFEWWLEDVELGNEVQSDSVSFDMVFSLEGIATNQLVH